MDQLEYETSTDDEDGKRKSSVTSGFIELSAIEDEQQPVLRQPPEPVVVTTVNSHDSDWSPKKQQTNNDPLSSDLLPRNAEASIRLGMTWLCALLVPAAIFTVLCAPRYRFLIATCWLFIISLFIGLLWVVRLIIMKDARAKILHPYLHAVAEAIYQECKNFQEDWNEQVLLLTDGRAEDEQPVDTQPETANTTTDEQPQSRRKPKSKLFRAFVQPFLPMMGRRRRQRQKNKEKKSSYQPPPGMAMV